MNCLVLRLSAGEEDRAEGQGEAEQDVHDEQGREVDGIVEGNDVCSVSVRFMFLLQKVQIVCQLNQIEEGNHGQFG